MEFFSDWNFYGLCAFGLLCIGAIVWQRMYYARLAMEHLARVRRQEALEAKAIERRERLEALDAYNEACNGSGSDEYRRRLNAGIANQHSASMEPFCGEGKKP